MPAELWRRFEQRDRNALARLLTLIDRGQEPTETRSALAANQRRARVVAITGNAGVGKSSLIGRLIELLRTHDRSVAVLACDPQSPLTGGALLGDRVRMPSRPDDTGLFIRSLTAAPGGEALGAHLELMLAALSAFGFDVVLLETAGAGQADTAVRHLADVVVLLVQPESGDDLQWQKAGLLEVADVVVVHKADLPGADRLEAQLRGLLNLPGCRAVPILRVSSSQSLGLEGLWNTIESVSVREESPDRDRQRLVRAAQQLLAQRAANQPQLAEQVLARRHSGELSDQQAAEELLRRLCK